MTNRFDPLNGLWVVDADGGSPRHLLTGGELSRPLLIDLSARGIAFVASADYLENPQTHRGPRFAAVDLATGKAVSLDALPPPMWGTPRLPMLTFSPKGGQLLFVTVRPSRERRLLVRDLDRQETITVLDYLETWFGGAEPTGMVWGRNQVVFVPGPQGSAILLRLDVECAVANRRAPISSPTRSVVVLHPLSRERWPSRSQAMMVQCGLLWPWRSREDDSAGNWARG